MQIQEDIKEDLQQSQAFEQLSDEVLIQSNNEKQNKEDEKQIKEVEKQNKEDAKQSRQNEKYNISKQNQNNDRAVEHSIEKQKLNQQNKKQRSIKKQMDKIIAQLKSQNLQLQSNNNELNKKLKIAQEHINYLSIQGIIYAKQVLQLRQNLKDKQQVIVKLNQQTKQYQELKQKCQIMESVYEEKDNNLAVTGQQTMKKSQPQNILIVLQNHLLNLLIKQKNQQMQKQKKDGKNRKNIKLNQILKNQKIKLIQFVKNFDVNIGEDKSQDRWEFLRDIFKIKKKK